MDLVSSVSEVIEASIPSMWRLTVVISCNILSIVVEWLFSAIVVDSVGGPSRRVRVFDASADLLGRSKCLVQTTPHCPAAQQSVPRPHHVRLFFYAAPPLQPGPLRRERRDLGRSRDLCSPVALTVSPGFGPGHNGYRSGCRRAQFVFLPSQRPRRPRVRRDAELSY
ncbi:hypothetical protein NDU88_006177 [Pleurodeles waltl]|uniref:Uncharacterized protein n=1 Tax=Pleurodeles waltl TaxID=8319 RepID=A0AAV7NSB3_PLEWA|nr:hypothetical protein NDU88_006177 [Pleurodeles waltl]